MFRLVLAALLICLWTQSAECQSIGSPADQAAIERDLAAKGNAQIIVDLTQPATLAERPDKERIEQSAQLVEEFLKRARFRAERIVRLQLTPTFAIKVTRDDYKRLRQIPGVWRISYNGPIDIRQGASRDPEAATKPLDMIGRNLQLVGAIDALGQQGLGGQSYIVAIIDTGIDPDHRAFSGRVAGGHCFSTSNADFLSLCPGGAAEASGIDAARPCEVLPTCEHGTATASLAVGVGVTPRRAGPYDAAGVDLFGVAPRASVYPIMVMSQPLDGDVPRSLRFDLRRALQHIYLRRNDFGSRKFAAVNVSLNAEDSLSDTACDSDPIAADIAQLRSVDIATVISAGNSGNKTKVAWPACVSGAVVVASSDLSDQPSNFTNFAGLVDFFAPGEGLQFAVPGDKVGSSQVGTSLAAPHVAGAFAVVRSSLTSLKLADAERALKANGLAVRVGSISRPRIQVAQASAAARPGWLNPSWRVITFQDGWPLSVPIAWNVLRGSAVWEVVGKPAWIDVSGMTGRAPDNPVFTVWLNSGASSLPDGTKDWLRIRNNTVPTQPPIAIQLIYRKSPVATPGAPFWLTRPGYHEQWFNPAIMQADVVVNDSGDVTLVSQGFPPDTSEPGWGYRTVKGRSEISWKVDGLPTWLTAEPGQGRLLPEPFENPVMFTLLRQNASGLAPGQKHSANFFVVQADDSSKRVAIDATLYVHRPPSHLFQLTRGRGAVFAGPAGGPFESSQSTIEVLKQGGDVQWEVANLPKWLSVSQAGGSAPSSILLSTTAAANEMEPGYYSTYIVFRNLTGYQPPVTRIVTLIIDRR